MKSLLSVAFFVDLVQSPDRFIPLLELAISLMQEGVDPHIFVLVKAEQVQDFQNSFTDVPLTLLASQPCPFSSDDWSRQRMQEFVDFWLHQNQKLSGCAGMTWDGIYHAQDVISASALTILQDLGFIEQFLFTLQELPSADQSYLAQWYERSLQAAKQCFCTSPQQQSLLQEQFNVAAQLIPLKKRSRIQQRRRWERQIAPDVGANPSAWQELVQQHIQCYVQHLEWEQPETSPEFLYSA